MMCADYDADVIFEEDIEEEDAYFFAGQGTAHNKENIFRNCKTRVTHQYVILAEYDEDGDEHNDDADVQDNSEPDVPDPYDRVYANLPSESHMLKSVENCKHCTAKRIEGEPPGFCCRSGQIHLETPDPPPALRRLWSSSDADARHFRANIRFFNGHFSFTSLYCHLDRVTTNMKTCGIYTFRAHGQIYHNIRSFGKEDGVEKRHLELYFYDDDASLAHRMDKCREKCAKKDREVIEQLVGILNGNPYSQQLRRMGHVENVEDYHIEFNLDQRVDQRTYNKPVAEEVAAVWVEGSERQGQFQHSVVLQGKDRSIHGIRSYMGCYDPLSYPLFFPKGELGWHNCIPKRNVTMEQVERAKEIRKKRKEKEGTADGDDDGGTLNHFH